MVRNPESAPQVLDNKAVQALKEQRAKLEAEYAQNLSTFKPEFPRMVQLKAQIDESGAMEIARLRGARPALPTVCCAGCATTPR